MVKSLKARSFVAVALGGLALGLTGCGAAPAPTGTVNVQVQTLPEEAPATPVDVVVSVDGAEVASFSLGEGEGYSLGEIPFGRATIEAVGVCSGESELLSSTPTMSLLIENNNCAFGD